MSYPYSQEALELHLGYDAGVIFRSEIIDWADSILVDYEYNDDVAELSMSRSVPSSEFSSRIGRIAVGGDQFEAMRVVLGRMFIDLSHDMGRVRQYTRFMECFSIQHDYDLPDDMNFFYGVDDDFALAEQGIFNSFKRLSKSLLKSCLLYTSPSPRDA